MKLSRRTWLQIFFTTLIRTATNTGFRMVFPFQAIYMDGFGISLEGITRLYAGQSLAGMISPLLATVADTRGRRVGMVGGLVAFTLGCLVVSLVPTPVGFLVFLILSMLGKALFDPSLLAYYGDAIPLGRRGFVVGITETSWSLSFFLGVPAAGFLMSSFGLLAPFLALTMMGVLSLLGILILIPPDSNPPEKKNTAAGSIRMVLGSTPALAGLAVMLVIGTANQLINAVFGVWLSQSFGLQIAALGGAAAVIGLAELAGEGGVSAFADRIGPSRAVLLGLVGSVASSLLLPLLSGSQAAAYLGLFLFFLTFEFTIVSLIPLLTGVLPPARGTVLALGFASLNLGRGLGSLLSAPLFLEGFWLSAVGAAMINLLGILALRYAASDRS